MLFVFSFNDNTCTRTLSLTCINFSKRVAYPYVFTFKHVSNSLLILSSALYDILFVN